MNEIENKIDNYKSLNDVNHYKIILDAADLFILNYPNGVIDDLSLELGIKLLRELISLTYLGSLHQYEHNYDLQNEILFKKIKVFKLCIPESHSKLRGLTEMLVGMKENSV
jgi:hypothetical protein